MKLAEESVCTGCGACYASCPHQAISMQPDDLGFLRPVVDSAKCCECGLCALRCPVLKPLQRGHACVAYVMRNKQRDVLANSSSGGVFCELARCIVEKGGCVYGARLNRETCTVEHCRITTVEEIPLLQGSKYVQSDLHVVARSVVADLKSGRRVLFVGTPCQIAAVKAFADDPNLVGVEVICACAPSPAVFHAFLQHDLGLKSTSLLDVKFRDKQCGWHGKTFKYVFADHSEVSSADGAYLAGMNLGITVRSSCGDCRFNAFRSGADLTIGDAWGARFFAPEFADESGASVVFVNTDVGNEVAENIKDGVLWKECDVSTAASHNRPVLKSFGGFSAVQKKRDALVKAARHGQDLYSVCVKLTRPSILLRMRQVLSGIKRRVLKFTKGGVK